MDVFPARQKSHGVRGDAGILVRRSAFSPDGKWIAYQSAAQPSSRIYVRAFPPATPYVAPEDADSHHPAWSPDGGEIFYIPGGNRLGSFSFKSKPGVSFGSPVREPRSGFSTAASGSVRPYDVMPDGKHFIGVIAAGQSQPGASGPPKLQVVLNWFEEVKQRAPGK